MNGSEEQKPKKESFTLFGILLTVIGVGVLAVLLKIIGLL
jgi:hypothetical protein